MEATTLDLRLSGGLYALSRLLTTLLGKRIPVRRLSVASGEGGLRVGLSLGCSEEEARRYATLLGGLEDVEGVEAGAGVLEVAVVHRSEGAARWRRSAPRSGLEAHEFGETVVASGEPADVERWLAGIEYSGEVIRLGPVARPGMESR